MARFEEQHWFFSVASSNWHLKFIYSISFDTWSHYLAQADFEIKILLSQPPEFWDYRGVAIMTGSSWLWRVIDIWGLGWFWVATVTLPYSGCIHWLHSAEKTRLGGHWWDCESGTLEVLGIWPSDHYLAIDWKEVTSFIFFSYMTLKGSLISQSLKLVVCVNLILVCSWMAAL